MKRDLDVIRSLLLKAESSSGHFPCETEEEIYNAVLLQDAGLIEGRFAPATNPQMAVILRLTWQGHDFLDAARNDTIWNKAKENFLKPGISWTFSIVFDFLKAEAQRQVGSALGIPPTP
jgi:hypothetical protein